MIDTNICPESWDHYNPGHHRCTDEGYANPEIVLSAGHAFAALLREEFSGRQVTALVLDRSTAVFAICTRLAMPELELLYRDKVALKAGFHREARIGDEEEGTGAFVLIDDYVCDARTVKYASEVIGKPLDLCLTIDGTDDPAYLDSEVAYAWTTLRQGERSVDGDNE